MKARLFWTTTRVETYMAVVELDEEQTVLVRHEVSKQWPLTVALGEAGVADQLAELETGDPIETTTEARDIYAAEEA